MKLYESMTSYGLKCLYLEIKFHVSQGYALVALAIFLKLMIAIFPSQKSRFFS